MIIKKELRLVILFLNCLPLKRVYLQVNILVVKYITNIKGKLIMNKLAEEIEENLDDIEYYLSDFYEFNDEYKEKLEEINSDKSKNTFQKIILRTELSLEHKKDEKYLDGILDDFKDIKKSKLLFFMGSIQEFVPIETNSTETSQKKVVKTYDCYYLCDVDHVERVLRPTIFGKETKRVKIKNEIDIHSHFDFIDKLNNKINKEDLKNYVNDMIEKNDFQTWDELRTAIVMDLEKNKDMSKEEEDTLEF